MLNSESAVAMSLYQILFKRLISQTYSPSSYKLPVRTTLATRTMSLCIRIVSTPAKLHLVNYAPDRAIMMMNCSLLISFLMICRLLQSVRASGRMKGVTGADWASFCLRRVATSVYRRKGGGGGGGGEGEMGKKSRRERV